MAFDYKKEYKALYMPKSTPAIVDVPVMKFIAVMVQATPMTLTANIRRLLACYIRWLMP